jgi:hypothetical protein
MQQKRNRSSYSASLIIVALVAFTAGAWLAPLELATAEVRKKPTQPRTFQSGGERSETVLREMSQTLKTMDARLRNIESAVKNARAPR